MLPSWERSGDGEGGIPQLDATDELSHSIELMGRTPENLPLVASQSVGSSDAEKSAAFLASLPSTTRENPDADPVVEQFEIDLASIEQPAVDARPPTRVNSWATAALGVTLGLTLTSGAYLPELMHRVRKARRRKLRQTKRTGKSPDQNA